VYLGHALEFEHGLRTLEGALVGRKHAVRLSCRLSALPKVEKFKQRRLCENAAIHNKDKGEDLKRVKAGGA